MKLYWGEEPVEGLSSVRGRRVLNGVWRFMPAVGPALNAPEGSWGYIRVPGAWHMQGWAAPPLDGVVARGSGVSWEGVELGELARAWYEREVLVPETWRGREILLNVERLCTDAVVYVNGRQCGPVRWPGGEVVLTPFLEPGRKALLRMLVVTTRDGSAVDQFLDGSLVREAGGGSSFARGLVGDVILESRPQGTRIDGVFVQTSVRRRELTVDVDLVDVGSPGQVRFVATIEDSEGSVVRRFDATRELSGDATQTVRLAWKWEDAELWDLLQPNLYTLYLKAEGPGLDDEFPQRFGFREFRISGKQFLLNEKPFRLRPIVGKAICNGVGMLEAIDNQIDSFISAGFNLVEIWPKVEMQRGLVIYWKLRASVADEKGLPLMYPVLNPGGFVGRQSGTDQQWAAWEEAMADEWRKVRNHPSIVVLVCTANVYQHLDDQNPTRVGNLKALAADTSGWRLARLFEPGLKTMDIVRKYDATRPVTAHHGAAVGDFHTCDMYPNLIPLQEREEWLSAWAESNETGPYMAVEFGTPWMATMHRGRGNGSHARTSEPLLTEYCAIYMGADAYRNETDAYRRLIRSKFQGGHGYDMWGRIDSPDYNYFPNHLKLQALFIRNTWRSWRTWGMTGGLLPWANGYGWKTSTHKPPIELPPFRPGRLGPYVTSGAFVSGGLFRDAAAYYHGLDGCEITEAGKALVAVNSATLAWIAGPPDAFTAKDHHFFSDTVVGKQVVLINDERSDQDYEASWTVEVGGRQIASGGKSGSIGPAQNVFIPFEFSTPEVKTKTDAEIILTARIGNAEHRDAFAFRVFPRPTPPGESATVLSFDPAGETTALVEQLGWRTQPWDGTPASGEVLVVGRNALSGGGKAPGALESFVARGGRAIIFGQAPEWLRENVGLRVARHVSRRFYPVPSQSAHPVIAGLDAEDLRDWRGAGTLVAPTANTGLDKDFSDWRALGLGRRYGWHWRNQGSVSSAALEKPHRSGWRPILEGEFDLAYSPLMELNYGAGLAIWCSLDVEGRTQSDPVAEIIAQRLLAYAAGATVAPRMTRAVYLGGAEGQKLLELVGIRHEKGIAIPDEPGLLIVGADYQVNERAMRTFLSGGGRALFLARDAGPLPLGYQAGTQDEFRGSLNVPAWPECRGLSESDLRLRTDIRAALLLSGPGEIGADGLLARLGVGRGVALFMQLAPDMLKAEENTYLRFSAWRLTRTVAQILADLGGSFEADRRSLQCLDSGAAQTADLYHPDYLTDFELGDDPYRYKRW